MKSLLAILISVITLVSCSTENVGKGVLANNKKDLQELLKELEPGDVITLKNGVWKDVDIKFFGEGTEKKPITLQAETPGEVFLEGTSSLKLGGSYLKVDGLTFRNGFSEKAVIRYKVSDDKIAYNSVVTNCAIIDYTNPDRDSKNHWVELYGQHNSFDHNYLTGKTNQGPTVRVYLNGNQNINTYHQIVDNHFGPRPRKGGPRAETLQIGDSYTSMTPAYVNVARNYFERCNGEVEIISSKSNFNTFRNNVFFESEGSLVLRHGNYATVDGNVFIGNENSKFIGGIRVINTGHWITNNYFYKLKGEEFRAPIAVMNGIPKSPQNRYNQVTDVVIAYNSFIENKTPLHFGVGANLSQAEVLPPSEIRSARAARTVVANNMVYTTEKDYALLKEYDSITGVNFKNNRVNVKITNTAYSEGFNQEAFDLTTYDDTAIFASPVAPQEDVYMGYGFDAIKTDLAGTKREDANAVGALLSTSNPKNLLDLSNYGPAWRDKESKTLDSKTIAVTNAQELVAAVQESAAGDIISLAPGTYTISKPLSINKPLIIQGARTGEVTTITATNTAKAFELQPRANLVVKDLNLVGAKSTDAFATLSKNMGQAYQLEIDNVKIDGFKSVLETSKASFADTIAVRNSTIINTENGILLNKEVNDKGDYNSGYVVIENSTFKNVSKNVLDYYRGGYDESTIGGILKVKGNTFENCGKQDATNILLRTRGIVNVTLKENTFKNNSPDYVAILWGEKGQKPENNTLINSGSVKVVQNLKLKLVY